MRKSIALATLVVLSSVAALPVMAAGPGNDTDHFRFECPNASGGTPSERLTNYGTYIRGMGEENVGSHKILPVFKGPSSSGIPTNLGTGGYSHAGTWYNAATGKITCLYTSPSNDPFNVSYAADNIKHGAVLKSDNSAITIRVIAG
jgi:hypothetical protein